MGSYQTGDWSQATVNISDSLITENHFLFVSDNKYVFTTSENTSISVQGIDKKIASHILRHSHRSLLTELGIPLKAIMARVGHEASKTTLRIYTHTPKNMQADLIDKLDNVSL